MKSGMKGGVFAALSVVAGMVIIGALGFGSMAHQGTVFRAALSSSNGSSASTTASTLAPERGRPQGVRPVSLGGSQRPSVTGAPSIHPTGAPAIEAEDLHAGPPTIGSWCGGEGPDS